MTATPSTDPVVLRDVEDLAEADLDADLAERLESEGRVYSPADAVALAEAIRREGADAAAAHDLDPEVAALAD
jgi:hypothetical protein